MERAEEKKTWNNGAAPSHRNSANYPACEKLQSLARPPSLLSPLSPSPRLTVKEQFWGLNVSTSSKLTDLNMKRRLMGGGGAKGRGPGEPNTQTSSKMLMVGLIESMFFVSQEANGRSHRQLVVSDVTAAARLMDLHTHTHTLQVS